MAGVVGAAVLAVSSGFTGTGSRSAGGTGFGSSGFGTFGSRGVSTGGLAGSALGSLVVTGSEYSATVGEIEIISVNFVTSGALTLSI